MKHKLFFIWLFCLTALQSKSQTLTLDVGSGVTEYPAVTWLKGAPIQQFDKDRIYIIECWATWCGPCMAAIPHLNELHRKYGDKITIIGQSVMENDLTKVRKFVQEKGEKMAYTVAYAGGSESPFAKKWLVPAGVTGIPQTFVIQHNKIVWTPSPSELTEAAIELLINGRFSLAAVRALQEKSGTKIARDLLREKRYDAALDTLNRVLRDNPEDGDAIAMKGMALEGAGRLSEAGAYYETVHQQKIRVEVFLSVYRNLTKRGETDKLLETIRKDIARTLADSSTLIADVIMEGFKIYGERKDYAGMASFITDITRKSNTAYPLFSIVAISQFFPAPASANVVYDAVYAAGIKHMGLGQMDFHYLNGALKMFWNSGNQQYARQLAAASIRAGKRDRLPESRMKALQAVSDQLKKGVLPSDEEFAKLEKEAKK